MYYISTRDAALRCTASQAIVQGLSRDGGLFLPERIPALEQGALEKMKTMPYAERAVQVMKLYLEEFTEDELRTIGELATRYDAIVIEDLAYLCMDFRKPLGRPFEAPYQASVARYTDNYILLVSGSKIFSYAGQRIAVAAISDALFRREYPALRRRYNIGRLGDAYVLVFLYAASSGTSHSAQFALAAMFKAAADGTFDFISEVKEYGRRAERLKKIFTDYGFRIVYDHDLDEPIADGFYFTIAYPGMTGGELMEELIYYGVSAISLSTTGSNQEGLRACTSFIKPHQYALLEERLKLFKENHTA